MNQERKHTAEKKEVKPTSKGFKRTETGKIFWHCLLRDDCVNQIGCEGKVFISSDEQTKFSSDELVIMPMIKISPQ